MSGIKKLSINMSLSMGAARISVRQRKTRKSVYKLPSSHGRLPFLIALEHSR
jgi:hypothetical protein